MITTLSNLINITHLPHQHLGWILQLLITLWYRDLSVIEDWFVDDTHLITVKFSDKLVIYNTGVDTGLESQILKCEDTSKTFL